MANPSADQLISVLQNNRFFAGLEPNTLAPLAVKAIWREYKAGETVVFEGNALPGLYFLDYGWLKVVKVSKSGREQVLRFLAAGEIFNEIGVFGNQPNPATAVALEDAGVWLIPKKAVIELLHQEPKFSEHLVAKMANQMLYLVSLVIDLSLQPVTGRLAHLLLTEAENDRLDRPRWYTQSELASRLGTVPDVIQRILSQLEKEEVIEVNRNFIRILDDVALAELIDR